MIKNVEPDEASRGNRRGVNRRPLVAVACKPPLVSSGDGWVLAPGGLAPIVRAALARRGGAWASWDGGKTPPPTQIQELGFSIHTFGLGRSEGEAFYAGYSNRTLWPLLHELGAVPAYEPAWWTSYRDANSAFAQAAALAAVQDAPDALFWIHDYHLLLVPTALRELGVTNPVAFFLHTPFPAPSLFARLPQRAQLLEGLAGADLVGFQTEADRRRFVDTWADFAVGDPPYTVAAPASIDIAAWRSAVCDPGVVATARRLRKRFFRDRLVVLGVERLDYTKGIPERLRALEVLLSRRRDLRRRLTYVQLTTPSREQVPEYRRLRHEVEREVGRLNGRFTVPGHDVPIRYIHRHVSSRQLLAYYVAADVALVTPLRDGMNLVAKEFVVAQDAHAGTGALVLSEFAGSAFELTDAFLCNPYDAVGTAAAIEEALEVDEDERRKRISLMADAIAAHDINQWADLQLDGVERAWARESGSGSSRRLRPRRTGS